MRTCCARMVQFLIDANKEVASVKIKESPDGDGFYFTIAFFNIGKTNLGWGVRIYHCPFCGKKLKASVEVK